MKTFKSHLTELFDTANPWNKVQGGSGSSNWKYRFFFGNVKGTYLPCPWGGEGLRKFFETNGVEIKQGKGTTPIVNGFTTNIRGLAYTVDFTKLDRIGGHLYQKLMMNSHGYGDTNLMKSIFLNEVYEMSFILHPALLKKGGKFSSPEFPWYWDYDASTGTDDDEARYKGRVAINVFGSVINIARHFINEAKPMGILFGTKDTASPARSAIYSGMARQSGAKVIDIPYRPREGMANAKMLWFSKDSDFIPTKTQ